MNALPAGWIVVTVGDVGEVRLGRQRSPKYHHGEKMRPYLRVANVFEDRIDTSDVMTMHFSDEEFECYRLRPGDVLLNEGQSPHLLGRPAIYRGNPPDVAFTNSLIRFRAGPAVMPEWALIVFRHHMHSKRFMRESRITTNIAHLSAGRFSSVEFPLPPLEEQKRLVGAVEEQFSRLDAGIVTLKRIRRHLEDFRDLLPLQLLARSKSAAQTEGVGTYLVGDGPYQWISLEEVSERIVDCAHWTPTYLPEGMPCIDTTCIAAGVIHRDRLRYVDAIAYQSRVRRLAPQHGDLIFAREGTVGTAVVVPKDLHPCLGQRVMLFRPNHKIVDSDYLCLIVNSQIVKLQYRPKLLGTTVPHLNVRDAKALLIPLPPLRIQRAIAATADRIGTVLSAIDTITELNITRSTSLRSSILAAAFSGKLVPQEPDDEPAYVLLQRIASERASCNDHQSGRARRVRALQEKGRA